MAEDKTTYEVVMENIFLVVALFGTLVFGGFGLCCACSSPLGILDGFLTDIFNLI